MINDKLINPDSIVVVGGSEDLLKPGGKILKNIIDGGYSGDLYRGKSKAGLYPGCKIVQGYKGYSTC